MTACQSELASARRPPGTRRRLPSARHPAYVPEIRINKQRCQSCFNHKESGFWRGGWRGGRVTTANLSALLMDANNGAGGGSCSSEPRSLSVKHQKLSVAGVVTVIDQVVMIIDQVI